MYFPHTTWTRLFFLTAVVQCVAALLLETYVVLTVENELSPEANQVMSGHTVPMYASLFIFGFAYELLLFWDSLRLHSMIQVVGLCIYNLLLMLYAIFQPVQIRHALNRLMDAHPMGGDPILSPDSRVWEDIHPALISLIWVLAVGTAIMVFLAYKLHAEFAWLVYKVIHADIRMRRRVFTLEINVALIKFNFFFMLGFLIQNLVQTASNTKDPEFGITIGGCFVVWVVAVAGILFARSENKPGTTAVIVVYFGGVAYLVYKLLKLVKEQEKMLTIFACITLLMLTCTILTSVLCFANYDKGLKTYGNAQANKDLHSRNPSENPILLQNTAYGVRPFLPHRMTID
ncbi:hypothetical protein PG995_000231 [Apiospora arundinis]